jgi:hydroxyacylglutathione hydrolase
MIIMFSVTAIPAFLDNYLWLLSHNGRAVIVDPGDATPVLAVLRVQHLRLDAILITHHHYDHIGGIAKLREQFDVPVYGPRAEASKIPALTQLLDDGDTLSALGFELQVMALPGHTLGHIAYYRPGANPLLFCGDTLFSAGCGRLFEGTPQQMHDSLARIAALPETTTIYCTHEYTLSNLAFAMAVEPDNPAIPAHIEAVKKLRANQQASVPTTLALEKQINPYLRTHLPSLRRAAEQHCGRSLPDTAQVFAVLRRWKDGFKAP